MRNMGKVIDKYESLYPGPQLILTYDNASSHVAVRKGALTTSKMNKTDGGKQAVLIQVGWFETLELATGRMKRVPCTANVVSWTRMSSNCQRCTIHLQGARFTWH